MEIVELIQPVTLTKDQLQPITIEAGILLKVLMVNPSSYLVADESGFSFLLQFSNENIQWKKL
ncbi:hypothetical protein ACFODO_05575 [Acinetobacter sichuanensis]|uniref:Uncharacterized protein n=1 Tax=Acinetobacter sichuanensis TaxID=2136183 RepID=A0A371YSG1_9GAMM|nr:MULTISPECIES: hypothetical protein [Acinetobacter]MDM1246352.1 hypothetical protein [Acinetobacter sp. R933-2]MDM1762935.1 hypothetical protein [Acinetobacter sp. 226-1]MDM1766414.1 hypothetical protein [Acinetobacter sp. 226-4]MDQ9020662.1 hypothetical protein [Acinetobacter sichuanensis]RFC84382.1 hypothetical protein C9E89_006850 [Acinetobacter sichuanensis]